MNPIIKQYDNRLISIYTDPQGAIIPMQNHTNIWTTIEQHNQIQADAIWDKDGRKIGIRTADCSPVLIWDDKSNHNCAIHAGWRGLLSGIIQNITSIDFYQPHTLKAVIGPTICAKHYAVSQEWILEQRIEELGLIDYIFVNNEQYYFDIPAAVQYTLERLDIKVIDKLPCNRCQGMPSHRENGTLDRIFSTIMTCDSAHLP